MHNPRSGLLKCDCNPPTESQKVQVLAGKFRATEIDGRLSTVVADTKLPKSWLTRGSVVGIACAPNQCILVCAVLACNEARQVRH